MSKVWLLPGGAVLTVRVLLLIVAAAPRTTSGLADQPQRVASSDRVTSRLRAIAHGAPGVAKLSSIGKTYAGRDVSVLQIGASEDAKAETAPAILVVGGIDADYPASTDIALEMADRITRAIQARSPDAKPPATQPDGPADAFAGRTVFVIPAASPDGLANSTRKPLSAGRLNARPVDEDRDGVTDEDGPDDLNGDGMISIMRVPEPGAEWLPDVDEPRLLKRADRSKGERGLYRLVVEGIDNDNDGEINEDGPGGVDNDRNWPHLFEAGQPAAGQHQLSEPENRAIADFVFAHPNIIAAVVLGRHDNIVSVPKGKDRGPDGQSYRDLHPDDVKMYEHLSDKLKTATGLSGSGGGRPAGALYSWLYAQRGILTLAITPWWPIGAERDKTATQPASQPASDATQPVLDQPDEGERGDEERPSEARPPGRQEMRPQRERFGDRPPSREQARQERAAGRGERGEGRERGPQTGGRGARGRGSGRPAPSGGPPVAGPAPDAESGPVATGEAAAARLAESTPDTKRWLKYGDEKAGGGFVAWQKFEHPSLGSVEIGGFEPLFLTTPPDEEIAAIAEKQVNFLRELAEMLPRPQFAPGKVKKVGDQLWEVEVQLMNNAYVPTHPAIVRHIQLPGWVVRPVDAGRVLGGRKMERADNLEGSGGAATVRWLIRGREGDSVEFVAYNRRFGEHRAVVELRATGPAVR